MVHPSVACFAERTVVWDGSGRDDRRPARARTRSAMWRRFCSPSWSFLFPLVLVEFAVLALLYPAVDSEERDRRPAPAPPPARRVRMPAYACRSRQLLRRILVEQARGDAAMLRARARTLGCRALQAGEHVQPADRRGEFVKVEVARADGPLWTLGSAVP